MVLSPKGKSKRILVLLIGEVLEDPRVYKTCISLSETGADVTVACTNPSLLAEREEHERLTIIRFPHRTEFFLKKLYNRLMGRVHPGIGQLMSRAHEDVSNSSVRTYLRNAVLNLNHLHFMKNTRKINRMMVEAFAGESFDLIHCNDVDTLFAGKELKRRGCAKSLLYDSHECWAGIGVFGSKTNDVNREIEADGIKYADFAVTVNPLIADFLKEEYQLTEKPSVVMNCPHRYNGELNVHSSNSPVRIIYQGKIQAFRGLPELIGAFRYIDEAVLTLSGYGPLEDSLKLLVKKQGLTEKVTFAGRYAPKETIKQLVNHDIGVISSKDVTRNILYSSPNKLFDYAMSGLAIASSDFPFLRGTIDTYGMGEIFRKVDPESIAMTINNMISDTEKLKTYKKNARKAAMETFCWEEQFWKNYPWKLSI